MSVGVTAVGVNGTLTPLIFQSTISCEVKPVPRTWKRGALPAVRLIGLKPVILIGPTTSKFTGADVLPLAPPEYIVTGNVPTVVNELLGMVPIQIFVPPVV